MLSLCYARNRNKRHNLVRSQRASLDSPVQHDHCTGDDEFSISYKPVKHGTPLVLVVLIPPGSLLSSNNILHISSLYT